MVKTGFIAFLFETMLEEHFISKRKMAGVLGVELRTLQYNFKSVALGKGGCVALSFLLVYCCENGISIDQLYRRYMEQKTLEKERSHEKIMKQEGILNWIYSYALKELFGSDLCNMALELRIGEGVIQRAMNQEKSTESMLLFERLMRYCMQHDISMDSILAKYSGERRA